MNPEDVDCQLKKCNGCQDTPEEDAASFYVIFPSRDKRAQTVLEVVHLIYKRDFKTFHDMMWRLNCKTSPQFDMRYFKSKEEAVLKYSVAGKHLHLQNGNWDSTFYTLEDIEGAFQQIA